MDKVRHFSKNQITYKGVTKSLSVWADELGIDYGTLYHRIKIGYSPEKAFEMPIQKRGRAVNK